MYPLAGSSVGSIMRPLSTFIGPRDLVTKARSLMRQHNVRTLPVVNGGRLEGVVTQREIMKVTSTRSNVPVAGVMSPLEIIVSPSMDISVAAVQIIDIGLDEIPIVQSPSDRTVVGIIKIEDLLRKVVSGLKTQPTVGQFMVEKIVTCNADDKITVAREIMENSKYSGLPVVRYDPSKHIQKVVGMLTRSDIIKSGAVRTAEESKKGRTSPKVKAVMRSPVITTTPNAQIRDVIEIMLKKDVKRLPVVDDGNLVGLISRIDIIKRICGG